MGFIMGLIEFLTSILKDKKIVVANISDAIMVIGKIDDDILKLTEEVLAQNNIEFEYNNIRNFLTINAHTEYGFILQLSDTELGQYIRLIVETGANVTHARYTDLINMLVNEEYLYDTAHYYNDIDIDIKRNKIILSDAHASNYHPNPKDSLIVFLNNHT